MFEQLNFRVNFNDADYTQLLFPEHDKTVLKDLARQVAELATLPVMEERRKLWNRQNKLQADRPLILCDPENGWNEIIAESDIQCTNSIARHWEDHLRKQIFWGKKMNDDYVVEPVFKVPHVYQETQWNVAGSTKIASIKKSAEEGRSYHIETILEDYSQLSKLIKPTITINHEATESVLATAHEIFDGILDVFLSTVWFWSVGMTDELVFLRGIEKLMFDFHDEPENVHKIMEILFEGMNEKLDWLESENLLSLNNDDSFIGSGGIGYIDTLPGEDFSEKVTTKHMWGLAESQITSGVSPDMFKEFIFPYQRKLMERFGMTCYGCCEPMDKRLAIVKCVESLRRVSVSPWADREIMAEQLGKDYIYSLKLSPTHLAVPDIDEAVIRKDLRDAYRLANDIHLELIMKDNHTLGKNPNNVIRWVELAREEMENI